MKFKYTLIVVLFLYSCSQKISQFRQADTLAARTERHTTETTITDCTEVRDTTQPAPREQSQNAGTDSSRLTTSLAWSTAVYRAGSLTHTIGNFPEIPSRIIYRYRDRTVHDTTTVRDTVRITDSVITEKTMGLTWMQRQWITVGKLAVLVFSVIAVSGFGKNILKRLL